MFYPPGTPSVHCITAEDSSWRFVLIYAGPVLFILWALWQQYWGTSSQFLSQDQRWMRGDIALGLPRWNDISLNHIFDFIDHVRDVMVVRRGIRILIIDCILSLGTVIAMIIALVATIVYWDENFAEHTSTRIVHIWPFIG